MLKKTFLFGSVFATLSMLVLSLGVYAPKVSAQVAVDAPNCYNAVPGQGYKKVECDGRIAALTGKPLEAGKCYLPSSDFIPVYNATPCEKIAKDSAQAEEDIKDTEEAATTTTRDEASNCNGTDGNGNVDQAKLQECVKNNPLVARFNDVINFLSIGVAVIVTIMVIIGGIQYTTSGSNPQAVSAAKKKILNAFIALIAYFLVYAFMQYLIPGGIF